MVEIVKVGQIQDPQMPGEQMGQMELYLKNKTKIVEVTGKIDFFRKNKMTLFLSKIAIFKVNRT